MKKIKITKGFTLVELLVAIGIMATLMAILLPNFMGARERARDAQKIQDLGAMKTALRLYYNDNQKYPDNIGTPQPDWEMLGAGFTGYMANVMNLGFTYSYYQVDNGDGFVLCTGLETGAGDDDVNSQTKCGVDTLSFGVCGQTAGTTGDKIYAVCAK